MYYEADWGSGNQNHVPLYITAYVDSFAQWDTTTQTIATADFSGHITAVNQSQTASKTFHLYSNTACSIKATAASGSPDNNGILTGPTSATLTTAYMLTGSGLSSPDGSWKAAGTNGGQFFSSSNSYSINYLSAVSDYPVTLQAQATSGASATVRQLHVPPDLDGVVVATGSRMPWSPRLCRVSRAVCGRAPWMPPAVMSPA